MKDESPTCINCGEPCTQSYCAACGQKNTGARRLSLKTLIGDFINRIYGFDGMLPRTLRDLTVRPEAVVQSYIKGVRVKYVGPAGYYFLTITLFVLIMSLLDIHIADVFRPVISNPDTDPGRAEFQKQIINIVEAYMKAVGFFFVLIVGFFTWLFFRKQGYYFLENMVISLYSYGHAEWSGIVILLLFYFSGWNLIFWLMPIQILMYLITCIRFYALNEDQGKWKVYLKSMIVIVTSYLVYFLLFLVFFVVYLILNPETLELIRPKN